MKNRILQLTRSSIPYVKELRAIAKSITGCIVMQELDYWFARYPNGFYKFLEPCPGHDKYQVGKSWHEELGISAEEFRVAFDKIGIRYKSKSEYDAVQGNKFVKNEQGELREMFYCSYFDKRAGITYYFRNHDLLDSALDNLLSPPEPDEPSQNSPESSDPPIYSKPTNPISRNRDSRFTETDNADLPSIYIKPETTTETTEENTKNLSPTSLRSVDGHSPENKPKPKKPDKAAKRSELERRAKKLHKAWRRLIGVKGARVICTDAMLVRAVRVLETLSYRDCLRAIYGCRHSAFHMGDNDKGESFNEFGRIFKDVDSALKFIGRWETWFGKHQGKNKNGTNPNNATGGQRQNSKPGSAGRGEEDGGALDPIFYPKVVIGTSI